MGKGVDWLGGCVERACILELVRGAIQREHHAAYLLEEYMEGECLSSTMVGAP